MKQGTTRLRKRFAYNRLSDEVRRDIMRMAARGASWREIVAELGVSKGSVWNVAGFRGWVLRREDYQPSERRLCLEQRIEIAMGLTRRQSYRQIASRINRAASTVCREVKANGGPDSYRPMIAHRRAHELARRPKATKLACNRRLRTRWQQTCSDCGHRSRSPGGCGPNSATIMP